MSSKILTLIYWLPLLIGAFVIAVFCNGEPMYMLMIYGGTWGLLYGTFYEQVIKPRFEKMEEDDESD